jgi:hypothetical protein
MFIIEQILSDDEENMSINGLIFFDAGLLRCGDEVKSNIDNAFFIKKVKQNEKRY